MKESAKRLVDDYYRVIGVTPEKGRRRPQVAARAAMMVAMRKYLSLSVIGSLFDAHHTTVIHHSNKHDANMRWLDDYKSYYDAARYLCSATLGKQEESIKVRIIDNQINNLKRIKKEIINSI